MTQPVRQWTVLVYMNDNNNLCDGARGLLKNQLAALDPKDDVAVAVEVSHLRQNGYTYPGSITHRRLEVEKHGLKPLQDLPYQNMADPKTLQSFLQWGIKTYPAEHYLV